MAANMDPEICLFRQSIMSAAEPIKQIQSISSLITQRENQSKISR